MPHFTVTPIELGRGMAELRRIGFDFGIEHVEWYSPYIDTPECDLNWRALKTCRYGNWLTLWIAGGTHRHISEVIRLVFLHLPAIRGEILPEIALLIQQAYSCERQV